MSGVKFSNRLGNFKRLNDEILNLSNFRRILILTYRKLKIWKFSKLDGFY